MAVEEKIGVVSDYLNRIGVAVIWLTDGDVRRGDQVRIAGRTTELVDTPRAPGCARERTSPPKIDGKSPRRSSATEGADAEV